METKEGVGGEWLRPSTHVPMLAAVMVSLGARCGLLEIFKKHSG
jgi:hypothetical protein